MRRSTDALGGGFCALQPNVAIAAKEQMSTNRERNKQTAFHCVATTHPLSQAAGGQANESSKGGLTAQSALVDQLRTIDVARGANAGECEVEALVIFVAFRAQREAAVLHCETATVPVVTGLHAAVLELGLVEIVPKVDAAAKAWLCACSVAKSCPELFVIGDGRRHGWCRDRAWIQGIQAGKIRSGEYQHKHC